MNPTAARPVPPRGCAGAAAHWIALWFGCGLAPVAPGTAGSLAAVAMAAALAKFAGFTGWQVAALGAVLAPPGIWASAREERATGKTDPGSVVVDEVAGQLIAFGGAATMTWPAFAGAFFLFRLFDIWKPFPISRLQSLPGGWGIMADDIVAGIYAALVLCLAGCFNLY